MTDEEESSISVKLKVHYTFDAEHKVDHLSRPPQSFQVDTAPIDESITIGVIDLRSCLDAIVASSPELTSFNENDFTVYAYDYSEPNTPLVGQGMLSKVLAHDGGSTEAMVTGRITQSVMAKFKKNVEPFLEVKLRLTPIASPYQRARSGSMSSVNDGMQAQWSGFAQGGPGAIDRPQSPANMSKLETVQRTLHEGAMRRDSSFNNSIPWTTSSRPSSRPGTPTNGLQYPPPPGSTHSRRGSQFNTFARQYHRRGSESGYWSGDEVFEDGPAKKRARVTQVQRAKKKDFNIELQPNSLRTAAMGASSLRMHQPTPINPTMALQRGMSAEEPMRPPTPLPKTCSRKPTGRPRGRPRRNRDVETVETLSPAPQTQPPSRLPESTVSSPEDIRDRQPNESTMSTPANFPSSPPVFPDPPPVTSPRLPDNPSPPAKPDQHQDSGFFSAQVDSTRLEENDEKDDELFDLNQADLGDIDISQWWDPALMPPDFGDATLQADTVAENHYTPVFDDDSTFGGPTPQPESQQRVDPTPTPQPEPQQFPTLSALTPAPPQIHEQVPTTGSVPQQIPVPILQHSSIHPHHPPSAHSQHASQNGFQRPALPPHVNGQNMPVIDKNGRPVPVLLPRPPPINGIQRSQSVLPPIPASDPGTQGLKRSNTWTADIASDAIMSDALAGEDAKAKRRRVGKEQTKARLEAAIAAGAVPPYCHNCGAIETPAWRRAFIKHFTCAIDSIETSLNPGEMCYKEVSEKNNDGSIKVWKGWKIDRLPNTADDEWETINLCNPCGLWFHKNKTPRPPEKWQKKDPKEKRKRKRPPKPPKSRTNPPRAAAGNLPSDALQSDMQEPPSEESSPADTSVEDAGDENNDTMTVDGDNQEDSQEPELPPMPKSIMSAQPGRRTVMFADIPARQVQSSPLGKGSKTEPIGIDLTPDKPLRRMLFSPYNGGSKPDNQSPTPLAEKLNDSLLPSFVRRSPRFNKTRDMFHETTAAIAVEADGISHSEGKENVTPRIEGHDPDFDDLFGDNDDTLGLPTTPTPKRRSERILLRTPGRTPSREFGAEISGNAKTPSSRHQTPKQNMNMAELFIDTVTRNLGPEFMTPHTRAIFGACSDTLTATSRRSRVKTGFTPHMTTPVRKLGPFDFPDLPSLKPSSPISHDEAGQPFSELPTDHLFSQMDDSFNTDIAMPSSPPVNGCGGWNMSEFDDMVNFQEFDGTDWGLIDAPDSASKLKTPKKQVTNAFLQVETPGRQGLRRSPRRAGHE